MTHLPFPNPSSNEPPLPPKQSLPPLTKKGRRDRSKRMLPASSKSKKKYTPEQRLLFLDTWNRSGLPATDFSTICGVSPQTLSIWRRRFIEHGPAGLEDKPRNPRSGSRLPTQTQRAILLLKRENPDWGTQRIHDVLERSQGYSASTGAIQRLLEQNGYEVQSFATRRHPAKVTRFERAKPNEMWQTDLFTFTLKRSGRRVYLVAFMDDHSRFIVGYGLHASAAGAMVRETLLAGIERYGAPKEVLTDNGPQYHSWRGRSAFYKLVTKLGIDQIVARPRHPQTLGKVERFWKTLWNECLLAGRFQDIEEARVRLGHFIDYYNFQRPHQGIGSLVPADRFFESAPEVKAMLSQRIADNAKELACHGQPRKPFYLTGRVGDVGISLHAEGQKVVLTREDGGREEVDLGAKGRRQEQLPEAVQGLIRDLPSEPEADLEPAPGQAKIEGLVLGQGQAWAEGEEVDHEQE